MKGRERRRQLENRAEVQVFIQIFDNIVWLSFTRFKIGEKNGVVHSSSRQGYYCDRQHGYISALISCPTHTFIFSIGKSSLILCELQ